MYKSKNVNIFSLFQDLICSVSDVMEPKRTNTVRVAITVTELLQQHFPRNNNSAV